MSETKKPERDEARTRILDAAEQVFADHGFAGARVDEIARRAGVNKAMLYYHVGDKKALYRAVLDRNFALIVTAVQERVAGAETPVERLRAFVEALALEVREIDHHRRIMLREIAAGGAQIHPELLARLRPIVETLGAVLDEGAARGEMRPTSPIATHLTIVGAVIFMTSMLPLVHRLAAHLPADAVDSVPQSQLELARFVHDLLLEGLRTRADQGE